MNVVAEQRRASAQRDAAREPQRAPEHPQRMHPYLATALAICGGLAVIYAFFAAFGAIDPGQATGLTVAAVLLALLWLVGFVHRLRLAPPLSQRGDRERRGF